MKKFFRSWISIPGPSSPERRPRAGPKISGRTAIKTDWGVIRVHPEGSYYYDRAGFSRCREKFLFPAIAHDPWPDPDDPGLIRGLKGRVQWIRENTDCAAILTLPAPFVHISQYLRGFEDWFMDFILDSRRLEALFDAVLEVTLQMAKNELQEVGEDVDIVICADDLGTQTGLQMSREHYVKYIKPRHEKFFRQVHELSPAKLLFHTCGSVANIIDDRIEIDVDILNPVQPTAAGMNPIALGKKYRGRIAFGGAGSPVYVTAGDRCRGHKGRRRSCGRDERRRRAGPLLGS